MPVDSINSYDLDYNEQWLWEVGLQFDNPREAPPIATLHQRLQYQRDVYSADVCA